MPLTYTHLFRVTKDRTLGYLQFFDKDHPLSDRKGRVWHHRHVASIKLGRWLTPEEVVHHADGVRDNNDPDNLEVMSRADHTRGHNRTLESMSCPVCENKFDPARRRQKFCSPKCASLDRRVVVHPTKEDLRKDILELSWVAIGRKYGVTDNAVRKWARKHKLL